MTKFLDNVYKNVTWIIVILSLLGYLAFEVLVFKGPLIETLSDWQTYLHLAFVIYLNTTMVAAAYNSSINYAIQTEEFEAADKLNNQIISSVNNELKEFRTYVKTLNAHELLLMQEDYLAAVGDKEVSELTKKELRRYKKLKPIVHNIYGFNLPLFYEVSKNGKVNYASSMNKNKGKRAIMTRKAITGLLFGSMTVNVTVSLQNFSPAILSLIIIMAGLLTTLLMVYFPQVYKFKVELPKKVILKHTLYSSYINYKNGSHILKKLELKTEPTIKNDLEVEKE